MTTGYVDQMMRLAEGFKAECFTKPEQHSPFEALGILLAHAAKWEGQPIFMALYAAFEDANYHTFCEHMEWVWQHPGGGGDGAPEGISDGEDDEGETEHNEREEA
jgi:hypothetical protein